MAPDYNQFYLVLELKYKGSYPPQADREMELDSFCRHCIQHAIPLCIL